MRPGLFFGAPYCPSMRTFKRQQIVPSIKSNQLAGGPGHCTQQGDQVCIGESWKLCEFFRCSAAKINDMKIATVLVLASLAAVQGRGLLQAPGSSPLMSHFGALDLALGCTC